MLAVFLAKFFGKSKPQAARTRVRLEIELLEDRTVPSTVLNLTGAPVAATEGQNISATLATISGGTAPYTVTIDWGDHSPLATQTVNGTTIAGSHVYADEGGYTVQVNAVDSAGNRGSVSDSAQAAEADVLTAASVPITVTAGKTFTSVVATFTDANPAAVAGDFTADVGWGDTFSSAGTITEANGTFTVTASHTYECTCDQVTVQINDDDAGTAYTVVQTTATILVPNNALPTLADPYLQTNNQGDVVSLQLQGSDTDGDSLGYSAIGLPAGLTIGPNTGVISGTISASPNQYVVTATVTDSYGLSDSKTFGWVVNAADLPPVAIDQSYTGTEDQALAVAAATGLLTGDSDPQGSPLTAQVDSGPTNGQLTLNPDGSFTYVPNSGYVGTDSFTYWAVDADGEKSNQAVAQLVVQAAPPVFGPITVSGRITYDVNTPKPVRYAEVELRSGLRFLPSTYTDADGYYTFQVPAPVSKDQYRTFDLQVYPTSKALGDFGITHVVRVYTEGLNNINFYPAANGPYLAGTVTADLTIGNKTDLEKSFWVYDATVTAALFQTELYAALPFLTASQRHGFTAIEYPALPGIPVLPLTSYTIDGIVHIKDSDYDDWDTIIHEYGHAVAQDMGFFPFTKAQYAQTLAKFGDVGLLDHAFGINVRLIYPKATLLNDDKLAFQEGFADWYSMEAQLVEGVSNPNVPGAGDGLFHTATVETGLPLQKGIVDPLSTTLASGRSSGEDEELTVMRILWDLADDQGNAADVLNGRQMDRVELGFSEVFSLIATNKVETLGELQHALVQYAHAVNFGNDLAFAQAVNDYNAVFELNNVSPHPLTMFIPNRPGTTWHPGDPIPKFLWQIPTGWDGGGKYGSLGNLYDRFAVYFYDSNYKIVSIQIVGLRDLAVVGNLAQWFPSQAVWKQISRYAGVYHWVVAAYGQALYPSDAYDFTIAKQ